MPLNPLTRSIDFICDFVDLVRSGLAVPHYVALARSIKSTVRTVFLSGEGPFWDTRNTICFKWATFTYASCFESDPGALF